MSVTLIDRFVEAVISGKPCRTSDAGPRLYAAISLSGLGLLTRHNLWPDAMRRVVAIGAVHPEAQSRFLDIWMRVGGRVMRRAVEDDDLFIAALRVLLPRYDGPAMTLYRGQLPDEPIGLSWSTNRHIALKFARYGNRNVDPLDLEASARRKAYQPRPSVVLRTLAPPAAIICAPCLLGQVEGEYLVDPRKLVGRHLHLAPDEAQRFNSRNKPL